MLLPSKHINISESIFGLSAYLLKIIMEEPKNIDQIWYDFNKINNTENFPVYHSFDNVIIALDYLYLIGLIDIKNKDKIYAIS